MIVDPGTLAVDYLLAARDGGDAAGSEERMLARLDPATLRSALASDKARLAFWIDVYNAAVLRQREPDLMRTTARLRFFRRPLVTVAGQPLSLDTIEHGLLRRSRPKLGLGYVPHPWPSEFERAQRVERIDPRVHFALNCAAASCPPIAAYRARDIDDQLDLATRSYLEASVAVRSDTVVVPAPFLWFMGDFGGPRGVRRFLRGHGIEATGRRLRFAGWDWTPTPGRWVP